MSEREEAVRILSKHLKVDTYTKENQDLLINFIKSIPLTQITRFNIAKAILSNTGFTYHQIAYSFNVSVDIVKKVAQNLREYE